MKAIFSICLLLISTTGFSQDGKVIIRQDTTLLKAEDCNWLTKTKAPTTGTVSMLILQRIRSGHVLAKDPQTLEVIPANKILTWQQASDTIMVWDEKKQDNTFKVVINEIKPDAISRVRIFHDWYIDTFTGKIGSTVRFVELLLDIYGPTGEIRGYRPFCRLEWKD